MTALPARCVLVFAPHPDDEVFGCGGALRQFVEAGVAVRVIIATDGGEGPPAGMSRDAYVALRRKESEQAAQCLGGYELVFWPQADRHLRYGERLVQECLAAIEAWQADLVLAPSHFEIHPDHRALAMCVLEAVRRQRHCHIAFYEVGQPLPHPNVLLDIGSVLEKKRAAMQCFSSQRARQDYAGQIEALNRYRTYQAPGLTAAEGYWLLTPQALEGQDPLGLFRSEHARQAALGLMADEAAAPLVSIIVRSIDRPTLDDALDSIALQTYPNIEVVLVNAKGPGHRTMPAWCGRFQMRKVDRGVPLKRAEAANAGLDAVRGDYLIFLDDDDWFDPDHITRLVNAAIDPHEPALVVYSGVRTLGALPSRIFHRPFDRVRLFAGNYIPIHAVLVARALIERGCRFDEDFLLLEDWDFLIQLALQTNFRRIDRVTANYRISLTGGSGAQHDSQAVAVWRRRAYAKWRQKLAEHLAETEWFEVLDRTQRLDDVQTQLNDLHNERSAWMAERTELLAKQSDLLAERDGLLAERQEILGSTSWRLTAPMRAIVVRSRMFSTALRLGLARYGAWGLLRRAWAIARDEGVSGVMRRIGIRHATGHATGTDDSTWLARYGSSTPDELRDATVRMASWSHPPLISVVMPTWRSDLRWLEEAVESVRQQWYPHWQLCIADDASQDAQLSAYLLSLAARDSRVSLAFRDENGHISAASNTALALARGEWVVFLDHDDRLAPHALYCVARTAIEQPDARIIYSDEDKLDGAGHRSAPHFKSDWNPDLFYSHNYIAHLCAIRRALIEQVGGFRSGVEGAQDYDLLLRCLPHVLACQIIHIPRILYHWRAIPGSTALGSSEKCYSAEAGIKALQDHFVSMGQGRVVVEHGVYPNCYRVRWPLPEPAPLVSLLIPTRDQKALVETAVRSILDKTTYTHYEILILDNGSRDADVLAWFDLIQKEDARVRVVPWAQPFNYSAINNFGASQARGSILGLINNDVEVIDPDWLSEMLAHAVRPEIGCVGAKLLYSNGTVQHGGIITGVGGIAGHSHKHFPQHHPGYFCRLVLTQNLSAVTGACLLVRREIFDAVGGMDEKHLKIAFNDVDFCLRVAAAGYRNVWTPYATLYHHESMSRGYEDTPEKRARFFREAAFMRAKWGERLARDPYYNPNLTLDREDFTLAAQPRVEALS